MNTRDLRVIRTRKMLHQALLNMMEQKDYNRISIREITDSAMVNRNTFYLHYPDKDALRDDVIEVHLQQIRSIFSAQHSSSELERQSVDKILNTIQNDISFYRLMVKGGLETELSSKMTAIFQSWISEGIMRDQLHYVRKIKSFDLMVEYTIRGVMGVIMMWIKSDGYYTIQEVKNLISTISRQHISDLL